MLDRHGQYIQVGYSEVEIEWLKAANTLDGPERASAFRDIASMSGRSFSQVQAKANDMRRQDIELKAKILAHSYEWRLNASVLTARSNLGRKPSELRQPSKAELMAGR